MYLWDAEDYRDSSSQQKKWGRELLIKLHLDGYERVLDIGCGDGKLTAEIAERLANGSAMGIDNSEEMIRLASEVYPPDIFPKLSWRVVDARELDFEGEFDVIFSNAALHWVIDHQPVLSGIRRSLKPGGRILLQMGGRGNASNVVGVLGDMFGREEWNRYFTDFTLPYGFYGPEEYKEWLQEAGLTPTRVELVPKDMVHEGRKGLAGWIRTTWLPFTQRIPEELCEQFIDELVDGYVRRYPPDEKGLVHVNAIRLEVEAENIP
jgi:trans-aconitate 2-methyltransferase